MDGTLLVWGWASVRRSISMTALWNSAYPLHYMPLAVRSNSWFSFSRHFPIYVLLQGHQLNITWQLSCDQQSYLYHYLLEPSMKPRLSWAGPSPFPGNLESTPRGSSLSWACLSHGGDMKKPGQSSQHSSALSMSSGEGWFAEGGSMEHLQSIKEKGCEILGTWEFWCSLYESGHLHAPTFQETPTTQRKMFHKMRWMSLSYNQIIQIQIKQDLKKFSQN